MTEQDLSPGRIGRPPKVAQAIYGHFDGKAALLVEASKHALDAISTRRLPGEAGIREIARYRLHPTAQVKTYYMLLIGLSHVDEVAGVDADRHDVERQVDALIDGWFTASA
jgi:sirohydrochlorin ferrochelatase